MPSVTTRAEAKARAAKQARKGNGALSARVGPAAFNFKRNLMRQKSREFTLPASILKRGVKTECAGKACQAMKNLNKSRFGFTRLFITEQPAKKFFTCTAKTNRLRVGVAIPGDNPPESLKVNIVLIYGKTQRVVENQNILMLFQKSHVIENGRGTFEFRIEEVSSRHNRQTFAFKIEDPSGRFKPAYTTGIDVKSKKPPKNRRSLSQDPYEDENGHLHLNSLTGGHSMSCTSCAGFLENVLTEIREVVNTRFEQALEQIRRCDQMANDQAQTQPGAMPMPPAFLPDIMNMDMTGVVPPPVMPPTEGIFMNMNGLPNFTSLINDCPPSVSEPILLTSDSDHSVGSTGSSMTASPQQRSHSNSPFQFENQLDRPDSFLHIMS